MAKRKNIQPIRDDRTIAEVDRVWAEEDFLPQPTRADEREPIAKAEAA